MKLLNSRFKFDAKIDVKSFEVLNSEFTKAKCYIMYTGENRNGSLMTKETVEAALTSIYNIPVIAEFIEKKEDFGGHGGKIIITSTGIEYVQTTVPYGVVPESANPRWKMVDDKEYLVADIILWSGRYDDLDVFLADGVRPQSMEITPLTSEETEEGLFNIKSFEFSALTILGSDVEPCFEDAKVETYELDGFEDIFKEMLEKYKKYLNTDNSEEEEPTVTEETSAEEPDVFSLTMKEKLGLLQNSIEDERVSDENGDTVSYTSYWVMDFDENYTYINVYSWSSDGSNDDQYVRASYSFDEANGMASIDKSTFEKVINKWVTPAEAEQIESSRQSMTIELEELREFKVSIDKQKQIENLENVLDEFSKELGNVSEFKELKREALEDCMKEDLVREKCFAILGRVKFEKEAKAKKEKPLVASLQHINKSQEKKVYDRYGDANRFFKPKEN